MLSVKASGMCCLLVFISVSLAMAQGHSDAFDVSTALGNQEICQAEYNPASNSYLVVWEDARGGVDADIYGQFVAVDGTLIGENFVLCTTVGAQYWPRIAVDPVRNLFLVVFEDQRNGWDHGDVRGVFVDPQGNLIDAPTSDEDHSFGISTNEGHIYTCSVAYNHVDNVYLAVWGDNRNNPQFNYGGVDVYGQLISADGTLISPNDPLVNFPIDSTDWYVASVADVAYNSITNEFFVGYGTEMGYVLGQRVNSRAELLGPDGIVFTPVPSNRSNGGVFSLTKPNGVFPAMAISTKFQNGPDCFQTRVASRVGIAMPHLKKAANPDTTEVQIVWKGMREDTQEGYFNDVYSQRIRFTRENEVFVARYVNLEGRVTDDPSNFAVSLQPGWAWSPELAYGDYDDEYLVGWGDPRNETTNDDDFYVQRLCLNEADEMIFLADDRLNTVTNTENIALATLPIEERSPTGIAYNNQTNSFLVVYQSGARTDATGLSITGQIVYGSKMPVVADIVISPESATVEIGASQQFTCQVLDTEGNEMDLPVIWSCTGGEIDSSGLFSSGQVAGSYTVTAVETNSGVSGTASVEVTNPSQVTEKSGLPCLYGLSQNYPNPFNPVTQIEFSVREAGRVQLKVFNVQGEEIAVLINRQLQAGVYSEQFDASPLPSGIYFYKLRVNDFVDVKKMVLVE